VAKTYIQPTSAGVGCPALPFCLECGLKLVYDRDARHFVCESCGSTYTSQELVEAKEKALSAKFEDERKRRRRSEYLEWWLSNKQVQ